MSLSPLFPHYGPLGSGPYHVSLAIPGAPSAISKSLGLTTPTGVLLPNVDYLTKFSEGDLGISDSFIKDMIFKNMNNSIASKNEAIFKQFAKQSKIDVSDISKFKKGNKFVMPRNLIKIPEENELTGFKALEKTTLQSIFETQKPYMEIVKTATETIAKAEDIIARVMPFFGNPLTTKSKVPTKNKGGGGGPKAIGYKKAEALKKELNGLQALIKKGMNVTNNTGSTSSNPNNVGFTQSTTNSNTSGFTSTHWQVLSTVYSTGIYNPKLDYDYKYIDLPADEPTPSVPLDDIDLSNGDPFENFKPKSLIFGIYNSKGEAIDPEEYLKTIGMDGNNKTEIETPFKRADWLLRSPKWKITNGYEWPSFAEPNYVWKNSFGSTKVSDKKPNGYSLVKYRAGQKDILTGQTAIVGNPVIQSFKKIEETAHRNEFSDIIDIGLSSDNSITSEFKKQVNTDVMNKIDLNSQLQISYLYSHSKISVYKKVNNKDAFPELMRKSYKPYEIFSAEAAKDPVLSAAAIAKGKKPGMIWVEPDSDYDMKIIRIDPISTIEYVESQDGPETETSITKFVKNRVRFEMSNSATFSFSISKNGLTADVLENVQEFTFENWNFENPKLVNTNFFNVTMWTKEPPKRFTDGKNHYSFRVDRPSFSIDSFLKGLGVTQSTPALTQQWQSIPTYDTYSITKSGGDWYFSTSTGTILKSGINKLGDGTMIFTENSIVKRWYHLYETKLTGPAVGFNLPAFGIARIMTYNYDTNKFDVTDKTIPLYRLKIDQKYSSSKIIDPSQVTNNKLTTQELFTKDPLWYGHGSSIDPQTLGIIKRYALTDLDTESYYIVEGVLRKENPFEDDELGNRVKRGGGGGKSWYRIGDAIGACRVFVNLLSSIFSKLIPKIIKLLSLLQNPFNFFIDIISEKMGKNVDFLTKESLSTFADAVKLRDKIKSQVGGMDNIKKQIDDIRLTAKNKADFTIAQADPTKSEELSGAKETAQRIQQKAENTAIKLENTLNKKKDLVNKLKDKFKKSILANYVHVDDNLDFIFPPGGAATVPLSLFGKDLTFGASLEMNNIPKKPPIKLIFPSGLGGIFKNVQFLMSKSKPKSATPVIQPTIADIIKQQTNDIKSPVKSTISTGDKNLPYNTFINSNVSDNVQVKFADGTTKTIPSSSLQDFVDTNKNKYDFIYVTEYIDGILREVDALIESGTPEDLAIAKEKLDAAKTKNLINVSSNDPLNKVSNSAIDDKIKELDDKNSNLVKNTQPLLKTLLGLITFPTKIIADIIKWLMDFFMSLTNPMTLASKMKEFLSFQWILQFFTPTGILALFGLKFQPLVLIPYAAAAMAATGKYGSSVSNMVKSAGSAASSTVSSGTSTISGATEKASSTVSGKVGSATSAVSNMKKTAVPNSVIPDAVTGIADMSKYINLGFIPPLPTYSASQYKNLLKGAQPFRLLTIFQMMEKFINGFIDFIWSLFGIEALIPAPHINMSSMYKSNESLKPEDVKKVVDGALPQGNTTPKVSDGLNTPTNNSTQLNPVIQKFVYEVKLPDGTTKSFLNRDELDIFVQSNSDVNFDFTF
jgi:hypothetical protein